MTYLAIQAPTTRTAAFTGAGVDISAITADFTLVLEIKKVTANAGVTPKFALSIQDSVNAFTAMIPRATYNHQGAVNQDSKQHGLKMTWRKRDLVGLRAGTGSAVLRAVLDEVSGAGFSIEYEVYLQIVS